MTDYDMDLILAKAEIATLKAEIARLEAIIESLRKGDLNGRCEVDKTCD
jgi:hypothetical protein